MKNSVHKRKILYILFFLLIVIDTGYSFLQHYSTRLDGDIAESILPADNFKPLFKSPFGFQAIIRQQTYPNPNRFFSHWTFKEYFRNAPLVLQKVTNPIDSIYCSCAIIKTIIQLCLIILLAILISGHRNFFKLDFILAALLIVPLFQTIGYQGYMGIIDPSITYTFFYAFPTVLVLLYFMPFIKRSYFNEMPEPQLLIRTLWMPLAIVVSLSGPLNPGIVIVFCLIVVFIKIKSISSQNKLKGITITKRSLLAIKSTPKYYWFYILPIVLFSLYSLYVGRYNSNNSNYSYSLTDLYLNLPKGIYFQFTQKLGFPVLFLVLAINTMLILKQHRTREGQKIIMISKWIGIGALLYILLLPLGGYRSYRPNVLRYDTIIPITISLMYVFGSSSLFLIKNLSKRKKIWYLPVIISVLLIYTNADIHKPDWNNCEREALTEISGSTEKIVKLNHDCTVLSWDKIVNPEDSELNAELLLLWKVTDEKRLYYH